MWDLPGPGTEPASLALAGGFLTTGPPGKRKSHYLEVNQLISKIFSNFVICNIYLIHESQPPNRWYFTWYKTLEQKKRKIRHFISQPFTASLTMESEASFLKLTSTGNPLLQQVMPDPIPRFFCLDAHHTHPSFLWMELNTKHWWCTMFWLGNDYCLVEEKLLFGGFCFYLLWLWFFLLWHDG